MLLLHFCGFKIFKKQFSTVEKQHVNDPIESFQINAL